jgi:hypothetical protein
MNDKLPHELLREWLTGKRLDPQEAVAICREIMLRVGPVDVPNGTSPPMNLFLGVAQGKVESLMVLIGTLARHNGTKVADGWVLKIDPESLALAQTGCVGFGSRADQAVVIAAPTPEAIDSVYRVLEAS